jgi:hypothetical protein
MAFHPCAIDDPRTGRRPRKLERHSSTWLHSTGRVGKRSLRAPRANRVFRTDEKHIHSENEVSVEANARSALCRN